MYANKSCTLYLESAGYKPVFIDKCFLTWRREHVETQKGLEYDQRLHLVFQGRKDLVFTAGKDYAIEGRNSLHLDFRTEKERHASREWLRISNAHTVMQAEYKDYGSARMRHWEVTCK